MPKKEYIKLEEKIVSLFKPGTTFEFKGNKFVTLLSQKPTIGKGEPKTDVFIRAKSLDGQNLINLKISVKMELDTYFVENKITEKRFNEIFSKETKQIISETLKKDIYPELRNEKIHEGTRFTLGWRCDIFVNDTRKKRIRIIVSKEEALEIYCGKKRPEYYRNAMINGKTIINSGVPDYIIETMRENINSPNDVLENFIPINEYINNKDKRMFDFCLVAVNLFIINRKNDIFKWDGNRPLFISIIWIFEQNCIQGLIDFNNIFEKRANEIVENLKICFKKANISIDSFESFRIDIQNKVKNHAQNEFLNGEYKYYNPQKTLDDF
jgi:hypothetical protein